MQSTPAVAEDDLQASLFVQTVEHWGQSRQTACSCIPSSSSGGGGGTVQLSRTGAVSLGCCRAGVWAGVWPEKPHSAAAAVAFSTPQPFPPNGHVHGNTTLDNIWSSQPEPPKLRSHVSRVMYSDVNLSTWPPFDGVPAAAEHRALGEGKPGLSAS